MGLFGFNMSDDDFANLQETSEEREAKMKWQSENPGSSLGDTALTPSNIKMPVSNFQNRYGNNADNRDNFAPTYTDSLSMFPERGQDPSGFKKWLGDAPNKYDEFNLGVGSKNSLDSSKLGLDDDTGDMPYIPRNKSALERYLELNKEAEANRAKQDGTLKLNNFLNNLGEAVTGFATARGKSLGTYKPDNFFDKMRDQNLQYYKNAIAGDDKKQSNAVALQQFERDDMQNDRMRTKINPNSPISRMHQMSAQELAKRSGVKMTPEQEAAIQNVSAQDFNDSEQLVRGATTLAGIRQKDMSDPKTVGDYYDKIDSPYADAVRTLASDAFKKRGLPLPNFKEMTPRQIDDTTGRYLGKNTSGKIMEMADGVYNVGSDGIATPVLKQDGSKLQPEPRASVQPKIINDGDGNPYVVSGRKLVPMEKPPTFKGKSSQPGNNFEMTADKDVLNTATKKFVEDDATHRKIKILKHVFDTYRKAGQDDLAIGVARGGLQILNNLTGPNAVGKEEAERLAGWLDMFRNPNTNGDWYGRHLEKFSNELGVKLNMLEDGINRQRAEVDGLRVKHGASKMPDNRNAPLTFKIKNVSDKRQGSPKIGHEDTISAEKLDAALSNGWEISG